MPTNNTYIPTETELKEMGFEEISGKWHYLEVRDFSKEELDSSVQISFTNFKHPRWGISWQS